MAALVIQPARETGWSVIARANSSSAKSENVKASASGKCPRHGHRTTDASAFSTTADIVFFFIFTFGRQGDVWTRRPWTGGSCSTLDGWDHRRIVAVDPALGGFAKLCRVAQVRRMR
jgi:hypothetical protein